MIGLSIISYHFVGHWEENALSYDPIVIRPVSLPTDRVSLNDGVVFGGWQIDAAVRERDLGENSCRVVRYLNGAIFFIELLYDSNAVEADWIFACACFKDSRDRNLI